VRCWRPPQAWARHAAGLRLAQAHALQHLCGTVLLAWRRAARRQALLRLGARQLQGEWAGRWALRLLQAWSAWAQAQRTLKLAAVALAAVDG
jgi:hypothetical protein